jgi:hypothetical protein
MPRFQWEVIHHANKQEGLTMKKSQTMKARTKMVDKLELSDKASKEDNSEMF